MARRLSFGFRARGEYIAWWDGNNFAANMEPGGQGMDDRVWALAEHQGELVAVGVK